MADNVDITLLNKTGAPQTLVVFQQDPSIDQIFTGVFPTAWRVFNVGATGGRAHVVLPIQYQIGAGDTNNAFTGQVSNILNTDTGAKWAYSDNVDGSYELEQVGVQSDNSISCENRTGAYCSMSLVKNDLPLLTYPKVGDVGTATFLPLTFIYIAWYNNLVEGAQIKASVSQPQALGIDLDGAKTIEGTLTKNVATGKLSWGIKVNGLPVSLEQTPKNDRPAYSVTESVRTSLKRMASSLE